MFAGLPARPAGRMSRSGGPGAAQPDEEAEGSVELELRGPGGLHRRDGGRDRPGPRGDRQEEGCRLGRRLAVQALARARTAGLRAGQPGGCRSIPPPLGATRCHRLTVVRALASVPPSKLSRELTAKARAGPRNTRPRNRVGAASPPDDDGPVSRWFRRDRGLPGAAVEAARSSRRPRRVQAARSATGTSGLPTGRSPRPRP